MKALRKKYRVVFRGAGDFVSGSIRRLHLAGFEVICTELPQPLVVRRKVAFADAVWEGEAVVEGVRAVRCDAAGAEKVLRRGCIPVIVDPGLTVLSRARLRPDVLVDGTMAKRNTGVRKDMAPVVVCIGPGFRAGVDCHAVVESDAGHDLGRVIFKGAAAPDTGVPGPPESYLGGGPAGACCRSYDPQTVVLRAPCDGVFEGKSAIGDIVGKGQVVGKVGLMPVVSTLHGVLRGLIHDGVRVTRGLKIGDVDPTCEVGRATTISEKSNAIAGGVLEAVLTLLGKSTLT